MRKFFFKINSHKDIILLDDGYANLKFDGVSSVIIDHSKINIFYLLISLWRKIFSTNKDLRLKDLYDKCLYESYSPQMAIGHDITGRAFKCKKICPHIITITYQHNYLHLHEVVQYKKRLTGKQTLFNANCDYFYVFDKHHKSIYESFVTANFIISGSTRNNEITLNEPRKEYGIMFISQYRDYVDTPYLFECQSKILTVLDEYCRENNEKLCVALNSFRNEKKYISREKELEFINHSVKDFEVEDISSYELGNLSEVIVCLDSNLGFELFSRRFKVLFVWLYESYSQEHSFPYSSIKDSEYFVDIFDKKVIYQKIDGLKSMKKDKWNEIAETSDIDVVFDEGNKILKKTIYKTLGY